MDAVFETERLDVRAWTHDDVETLFDIYRRWEVARWLGAAPKVAESTDAMHRTVDRWATRSSQTPLGVWAIVPRATGRPVGTVLLVPLQDGEQRDVAEVEVGWHLHPDSWGNGFATEAARGALDRAWTSGMREVYAVVHEGNDASVAVTRRLAMVPLGPTTRWYGVELDAFVATPETSRHGGGHQGP
jgi:RimJ/RimL family protein N-acetyltransferase